MQPTIPDLWPPDFGTPILSPVAILREQAVALGRKTHDAVRGEVFSLGRDSQFQHRFVLLVPELGNYTYELLSVVHDANMYPVKILPTGGQELDAKNEPEYLNQLRAILTSDQTRHTINHLLSQVPPRRG